jgi:hypothetical protein
VNLFLQNSLHLLITIYKKNRHFLVICGSLLLAGTAICLVLIHNSKGDDLDRLYQVASGDPQFSKGTIDSEVAIRKLANHKSERVTNMLVAIATRDDSDDPMSIGLSEEAIRALANRGDEKVGLQLAHLLQTKEVFAKRLAVAEALQQIRCNQECIGMVLHYLERICYGEPNSENLSVLLNKGMVDKKFQDTVETQINDDDKKLYDDLFSVLSKNERTTMIVLYHDYGLGSGLPTRFAISIAMKAKIGMACQLLLRSQELIGSDDKAVYGVYQDQIHEAVTALKCQ